MCDQELRVLREYVKDRLRQCKAEQCEMCSPSATEGRDSRFGSEFLSLSETLATEAIRPIKLNPNLGERSRNHTSTTAAESE